MRRCIGLDVHREFAEVAIWQDGVVRSVGQIETTPEAVGAENSVSPAKRLIRAGRSGFWQPTGSPQQARLGRRPCIATASRRA